MNLESNSKEHDDLCRLVDENDFISFDIYDTALLRNVLDPTDIFEIVSRKLKKKQIDIPDFKELRIQAERKARKCTKFEDITLEDIYNEIAAEIGDALLSSKIKLIELETEKEFTVSNIFIKNIYDYAKRTEKKVFFISDMYLPYEFLSKLLLENGFYEFDHLYISGTVKLSKASGNLYDYIKREKEIDGSWLHIGDNYKSDYENSQSFGIISYYYRDLKQRAQLTSELVSLERSIMKALQINYCEVNHSLNYWNRFGVYIVSSLFLGFTLWVVSNVKGETNLYFLSRDGYLPYKIYCRISELDRSLPKAKYMYASRKAYQIPNFLNMNEEEVLDILTSFNTEVNQKLSLGEIFNNVNLDKDKYLNLIKKFGFSNFDHIIKSEKERVRIKAILKTIYPDIINAIQKDKMLLEKYLKQCGVHEYDVLNIVDIGWKGSTQKAIRDITNIRTIGYYLGTTNVYKDIGTDVLGYAFHLDRPYTNMKKIMDNVMMFEFIFSAPHGTLERFEEKNGEVFPILVDMDDCTYTYSAINDIHAGVLQVVDKYLSYFDYFTDISREDCLLDYFNFINAKNYEDLIHFINLKAAVGIGDSDEEQNFVTSTSITQYYRNKKNIEFQSSKNLWKNALIITGSLAELKKSRYSLYINKFYAILRELKKYTVKAFYNPKKAVNVVRLKIIGYFRRE